MSAALKLGGPPAASRGGRRLEWVRIVAQESWKYLAASALALAVDYGLLIFLTEVVRLHYLISAAIGFTSGLLVTYLISVTLIFRERRYGRGVELAGFLLIGLMGLGLNEMLLKGLVEGLGLHYAVAKAPAAGISFLFNFVVRRALLFTAQPGGEHLPGATVRKSSAPPTVAL